MDSIRHLPENLADPVVIDSTPGVGMRILYAITGGFCALLGGYVFIVSIIDREVMGVAGMIMGLLIGAMFLAIGVFILSSFRVRSAFIAIGTQGINWHLNGDRWLSWNEISAVGISILYASSGKKTQFVSRIRIAGTLPELTHRPDLASWRTYDEPEPYTHKVVFPHVLMASMNNLPSVDLAAVALEKYAGDKYTGLDYRKTIVGRYT